MSLLNNILSSIDPSSRPQSPATNARPTQAGGAPKPAPRPHPAETSNGINGSSQGQQLKRKAEGLPDSGQAKIQRSGSVPSVRPNGAAPRPAHASDAAKPKSSTSAAPLPYRGTAGLGSSVPKTLGSVKKPVANLSTSGSSKPTPPGPKTPGSAPATGAAPSAAKKGSYAAMLAQAKEKEKTKPAAPPVKHEPTKILTKKERLALREQAKGKKPGVTGPSSSTAPVRPGDPKAAGKEKSKATPLSYQGTARPAKKPVDVGYKGTARPSSAAPGQAGKSTAAAAPAAKPKPKKPAASSRWDGYADWDDLDRESLEEEEEEGEDYYSDASSDMEGGIWDVEEEEQKALKEARHEDAVALAEENEHRRQKEERKRKLMAMNKAAAGKRKY